METEEKVIIKAVGQYFGHIIKKNKLIELKLKFSYDERLELVKSFLFVGQNITLFAKPPGMPVLKIGMFNFGGVSLDKDGQTILKLVTDIDYVEHSNLIKLVGGDELIKIKLEADIEIEKD